MEIEEFSSAEDSEEVEETEEQESGDEGFHLLGHTAVEEEEETESWQQAEEEEEEQQGGLWAQWKSTRVKFTPSKLSSAHLVLQEALMVVNPVEDVRPVGVLFWKINEGEPPAQRRVSLPQKPVLASETTEGTSTVDQTVAGEVVPRKDIMAEQGIGTTYPGFGTEDIGTVPVSTGTTSTCTGTT